MDEFLNWLLLIAIALIAGMIVEWIIHGGKDGD
jgi:hypothetical protein